MGKFGPPGKPIIMLLFSEDHCSCIIKHVTVVVVVLYFGGLETLNFPPICTTLFNKSFSANCLCEEKERTKAVEN